MFGNGAAVYIQKKFVNVIKSRWTIDNWYGLRILSQTKRVYEKTKIMSMMIMQKRNRFVFLFASPFFTLYTRDWLCAHHALLFVKRIRNSISIKIDDNMKNFKYKNSFVVLLVA